MTFVDNLKFKFANFLLNRRIFKGGSLHSPLDLDKAKTIGIVFKSSGKEDSDSVKALKKELKDRGKTVYLLEYFDSEENEDTILKTKEYIFLTNKDLTIFDLPKKSVLKDFTDQKFDMVISLCLDDSLPVHYILAIARADFKVGIYDPDYSHIYDFMINSDSGANMNQVISTLKYYLKSIHKN